MKPQIIRLTILFNALALFSTFGATAKVTFVSPCSTTGNHGVDRWPAKTDPERVPADKSKVTPITPSQMFKWAGVGTSVKPTKSSTRIASEQRWFALTGRVAGIKVEADGDIHIEIVDASGSKPGIVGAEIPPGKIWCEYRKFVFSWTAQKFPFSSSSKTLTVSGRHLTTVTGKAFYDVDHAPKDRSNERRAPFKPGYSVWEIHPVMGITR